MAGERASSDEDRKLEAGTAQSQAPEPAASAGGGLPPAFYIALWIGLSSSIIIFNKWILTTAKFEFPLFLTTWHQVFGTIMTQYMARFTKTLDSRHKVPMTTETYIRAIVPIGLMFSLTLICGNLAYLTLSVSFIQMLKATTAVAVLLATWAFAIAPPNMKVLGNVAIIVLGVVIASFGEIKFELWGFVYQIGGIVTEALRLVMVQRLLSSGDFKMDPLVSLYYYAPACAVFNSIFTFFIEGPRITMNDIQSLGFTVLLANGLVAFLLNVSSVLLIGQTSAVVLTMSGILKDILLVFASMLIFRDPVTGQQFFGYSIALAGLVYYKLGAEKMQSLATDARLQFADFRQKNPARTKVLGIVSLLLLVSWAFWILSATNGMIVKLQRYRRPYSKLCEA
ncbi:TPT-domain-containing protein [Cryphonectria parasitica EP155]|uniref:TPT-domain-containing protein n=1 Tax=Cryphonectria parasitica (strain ATCC 38755 / EP155) TaxID=660469 RepID=A0A9P5CTI8_CRYP1|nr:TPT-domain-containing protein [Cryphonectria parasitica EP155]KAF3769476.1 TPT-domain-containing protein [Cryphonectria parasitica EP155]